MAKLKLTTSMHFNEKVRNYDQNTNVNLISLLKSLRIAINPPTTKLSKAWKGKLQLKGKVKWDNSGAIKTFLCINAEARDIKFYYKSY